jgi:predicted transcriptional regulator
MNENIKNKIIEELKNDKILKGLLGMSSSEIEIYFILVGNYMCVEDISEILGIEKSSVYKCIKNLYRRKLVRRRKIQRVNGNGSKYVFSSVSLLKFKGIVKKRLDYWYGVIECLDLERKKDKL